MSLVSAIKGAIAHELNNIHTALPAEVSKYDKNGPTVEAKPLVKKLYLDGTSISLPTIVSVPVLFPRTSRFSFSFPLEKGDGVFLLFSERSIETWLKSGVESDPNDTKKFSLSDAIAIPGLWALGKGKAIDSSSEFELKFDDLKVSSDGSKYKVEQGDSVFQLDGSKVNLKTNSFNTDLDTVIDAILNHTHLTTTPSSPTSTVATSVPPIVAANFNTGTL